jgi:hypothetical protein
VKTSNLTQPIWLLRASAASAVMRNDAHQFGTTPRDLYRGLGSVYCVRRTTGERFIARDMGTEERHEKRQFSGCSWNATPLECKSKRKATGFPTSDSSHFVVVVRVGVNVGSGRDCIARRPSALDAAPKCMPMLRISGALLQRPSCLASYAASHFRSFCLTIVLLGLLRAGFLLAFFLP